MIQPIKEENGFIETFYEYDEYEPNMLIVDFHFNIWTDEDDYEIFYKFLTDSDFKIIKEYSTKKEYIISIKISMDLVKNYAMLYNGILNYNI